MTDPEIIQGLRRREAAALGALVEQYADPVYRLVRRILGGADRLEDAEECANDVFQAAWERIDRFEPERAPLRTWLLILAKYTALARLRALRRSREEDWPTDELPGQAEGPEALLAQAEERQAIQAALDGLPPVEKQLIYRRYFLGEQVDRLAEAFGLTRQAADNRLWRARRTLRARLTGIFSLGVAGDEQ